jgi:hypothetical protein
VNGILDACLGFLSQISACATSSLMLRAMERWLGLLSELLPLSIRTNVRCASNSDCAKGKFDVDGRMLRIDRRHRSALDR